jgi:hypothetical protein
MIWRIAKWAGTEETPNHSAAVQEGTVWDIGALLLHVLDAAVGPEPDERPERLASTRGGVVAVDGLGAAGAAANGLARRAEIIDARMGAVNPEVDVAPGGPRRTRQVLPDRQARLDVAALTGGAASNDVNRRVELL